MRFETLEQAFKAVQEAHGEETLRFEHTHNFGIYANYKAYRGDVLVADFGYAPMTGRLDGDFQLDKPQPAPPKQEPVFEKVFYSMDDYYDAFID